MNVCICDVLKDKKKKEILCEEEEEKGNKQAFIFFSCYLLSEEANFENDISKGRGNIGSRKDCCELLLLEGGICNTIACDDNRDDVRC